MERVLSKFKNFLISFSIVFLASCADDPSREMGDNTIEEPPAEKYCPITSINVIDNDDTQDVLELFYMADFGGSDSIPFINFKSGNLIGYILLKYNTENQIIEDDLFRTGTLLEHNQFEYWTNGNTKYHLRYSYHDKDSKYYDYMKYEWYFDERENLTEIIATAPTDTVTQHWMLINSYENNLLISALHDNQLSDQEAFVTYTYDENGLLLERLNDIGYYSFKTIYEYDELKREIVRKHYKGDQAEIMDEYRTKSYNEDGLLHKMTYLTTDGSDNVLVEYKFNYDCGMNN